MHQTSLTSQETGILINTLKSRFQRNLDRHKGIAWEEVSSRLDMFPHKLVSLYQMEETGGEPDVISYDPTTYEYIFCDCSSESPKDRRSLCYDQDAWEKRKENKPRGSAMTMAEAMQIELIDIATYHLLQLCGSFDTKTSSWIQTPENIRTLGGAIFGDRRYGQVFIYHNGAESYYNSRGFRGMLRV